MTSKLHAEQNFQKNTAVKYIVFEILGKIWCIFSTKLGFYKKVNHWLLSLPQYFHSSDQSVVSYCLYFEHFSNLILTLKFGKGIAWHSKEEYSYSYFKDILILILILLLYINVYISHFCCWHGTCMNFFLQTIFFR